MSYIEAAFGMRFALANDFAKQKFGGVWLNT